MVVFEFKKFPKKNKQETSTIFEVSYLFIFKWLI